MPGEYYNPVDLSRTKINQDVKWKRLSGYELVKYAIKDVISIMNFRSNLIEDYYSEISVMHTKRHLRLALKYIILFSYTIIMTTPIINPGKNQDLYIALAVIITCILVYLITFLTISHYAYSLITTIFCLLSFCLALYKFCEPNDTMETNYTPGLQLICIMYAVLPLKIEISICISAMYAIIYESTADARFKFGPSNRNDTRANQNKFWTFFNQLSMYDFDRTQFETMNYKNAQTVLWFSINISGLYLHICNQMRRRASFLRLGENVNAQLRVKEAAQSQNRMLEAVMPKDIKESYMIERAGKTDKDMWVFSQVYKNVSILFADIVGFTKMSSNKTAPQVVTLLNDLFNRFDELCIMTNCEKLGTLGDCYYCVAGCPSARSDHAVCCVEMGLGMCRIIQTFNNDYKESVDMRIGVHTGRVNAAIIGNQRFRFDVYSNDVIISNTMESSGLPGRVHISDTTYELVRQMYTFEDGEDLEVKKEEKYGVAGMKLTLINIKTFFVKPESSHLLKNLLKESLAIEAGKKAEFHVLTGAEAAATVPEAPSPSSSISKSQGKSKGSDDTDLQEELEELDADAYFVESLRKDPEHHIKLFGSPPLWPFSLSFTEEQVERKYHENQHDEIQAVHVDSVKLSPLFDCSACLIFTLIIVVACSLFFKEELRSMAWPVAVIIIFGLANVMFAAWCSVQVTPLIINKYVQTILRNLSIITNIQSFAMCSLPSFIIYLMYDCRKLFKNYVYTAAYFSVAIFSLICHALFIASKCWTNIFSALLSTIGFIFIFNGNFICSESINTKTEHTEPSCRDTMETFSGIFWKRYFIPLVMDLIQTLYTITVIKRENERNLRLCFYVTREATIRCDQANKAMHESQELLQNIIPQYVLDQILLRGGDISKGNFSYAVNVQNSAVIFSCISNFFSSYYREDYKGGEGALILLNKIICTFDALLVKPRYIDVEKIKTINDCYMVASGLNTAQVAKNSNKKQHLEALLKYSFDMQYALDEFNSEYVFGSDKFEMKIGYNTGPVTAGVIGTTKPLYDIWGDTVNVASRMYSTGTAGRIQVAEKTRSLLKKSPFKFTYKDEVFVKGKGNMKVYLVSVIKPKKKILNPVNINHT